MTDATGIRLDKWLWQARFFKTRTLAARLVSGGHVRVNAAKTSKPAHKVRPGDTLTFPQGARVRVVRVLELGDRRGPATEAQALYRDMSPAADPPPPAPRYELGGRPTKKHRRDAERSRLQAPGRWSS